jgi:hypothetical protein
MQVVVFWHYRAARIALGISLSADVANLGACKTQMQITAYPGTQASCCF